jgi:hypothetical protein
MSSIQTAEYIERAAADFAVGKGKNTEELMLLMQGFVGGSAWQREQGIEWISAEDRLPNIMGTYEWGAESAYVLITNGAHVGYTFFQWFKDGTPQGWYYRDFVPTHFAYINLPKTDKP